jgi:hypothetical protein
MSNQLSKEDVVRIATWNTDKLMLNKKNIKYINKTI